MAGVVRGRHLRAGARRCVPRTPQEATDRTSWTRGAGDRKGEDLQAPDTRTPRPLPAHLRGLDRELRSRPQYLHEAGPGA